MSIETVSTIAGIVLFVISEILSLNSKWKSNGVIQLILNILKKISTK